ncbi:hypothetical protein ACIF8T_18140 [Streptomyces sp. NPDC085946]|uniref:hypothetical protein n=1 Tax=Streptomyces sp. NPDC085946 TaxID=3365744 RepID=UPI0037D6FFE7
MPPQPADGNPFAHQPGAVPPARGNLVLGLPAAVVAALVTAGLHGAVAGATEYGIGYAAAGVGFLVGFAVGKAGGADPVLPVASAVLSLGAVHLGRLVGIATTGADELGVSASRRPPSSPSTSAC